MHDTTAASDVLVGETGIRHATGATTSGEPEASVQQHPDVSSVFPQAWPPIWQGRAPTVGANARRGGVPRNVAARATATSHRTRRLDSIDAGQLQSACQEPGTGLPRGIAPRTRGPLWPRTGGCGKNSRRGVGFQPDGRCDVGRSADILPTSRQWTSPWRAPSHQTGALTSAHHRRRFAHERVRCARPSTSGGDSWDRPWCLPAD